MGKKRAHPFLLRLPVEVFGECQALGFRHQVSLNLLIIEMVRFSQRSFAFKQHMMNTYPPNPDHGHFVYIQDRS